MKLKNQGKRLGGLLFLSMLASGAYAAEAPEAAWYALVNRAAMHVNDGKQSDTYFIDNSWANSRLGIKGEKPINDCLKVGGVIELGVYSAAQHEVTRIQRDGTDIIGLRHADVWLNGDFGKLSFGHGWWSSALTVLGDMSGTGNALGFAGGWLVGGSMKFREKATGTEYTYPSVALLTPHDALRGDRIRYDSPTFGDGFKVRAGFGSVDHKNPGSSDVVSSKYLTDAALTYFGDHDEFLLNAAASYFMKSKGNNAGVKADERNKAVWDVAVAGLHKSSGVNAGFSYAKYTPPLKASKKATYMRVLLGYKNKDLNCYGSTNFGIDFVSTKHSVGNDIKCKEFGFGIAQELKKAKSEAYVGIKRRKLTITGTDYEPMLVGVAGVQINFGGKLL